MFGKFFRANVSYEFRLVLHLERVRWHPGESNRITIRVPPGRSWVLVRRSPEDAIRLALIIDLPGLLFGRFSVMSHTGRVLRCESYGKTPNLRLPDQCDGRKFKFCNPIGRSLNQTIIRAGKTHIPPQITARSSEDASKIIVICVRLQSFRWPTCSSRPVESVKSKIATGILRSRTVRLTNDLNVYM